MNYIYLRLDSVCNVVPVTWCLFQCKDKLLTEENMGQVMSNLIFIGTSFYRHPVKHSQ